MSTVGPLLLTNDEGVDTHDEDPSNMCLRAGYLLGVATRTINAEDRKMLRRAARSLAYAATELSMPVRLCPRCERPIADCTCTRTA